MVKNILVLGSTGFLGQNITHALLDKKTYTVFILARGQSVNEKKELYEAFKGKRGKVVEGDLSDVASLRKAIQDNGVDTIVSVVGNQALALQPNILEAAKGTSVKRIVPSNFGLAPSKMADPGPILGGKVNFEQAIIKSGFEYTFYHTGGNSFRSVVLIRSRIL
jgi:uncharacterized protein YbjT (DUF2867 family)